MKLCLTETMAIIFNMFHYVVTEICEERNDLFLDLDMLWETGLVESMEVSRHA